MGLKVHQSSIIVGLNAIKQTASGATLRLFTNDVSPDGETGFASYNEATFSGYAPVLLGAGGSVTWDTLGQFAEVLWPQVSWTVGEIFGPFTVYGYFVLPTTNVPAWGERFASPVQVTQSGHVIRIRPRLRMRSAVNTIP